MGDLFLERGSSSRTTALSNTFIDEYMGKANGEFVKVYLYLLRCYQDRSMKVSVSSFADSLNCTEGDILRAFKYWEEQSLISVCFDEDGELSGLRINECKSNKKSKKETKKYSDDINVSKKKDKKKPSITELCDDEEFSDLVFAISTYLGKPSLTPKETDTVLYFISDLGFSTDLILYLVEHCISSGSKSMRYIEKVAISWATIGIETLEDAKEYTNNHSTKYKCVFKAFGITGRHPGQSEKEYINKWFDTFGFASEIVVEACNRTINSIHEPSFKYVDSILTNWHNCGITCLDQISELDEEHKNSAKEKITRLPKQSSRKTAASYDNGFSAFPQREYNNEELEQKLLKNRAF